ncbi:uncharacterized protein JCM6883_006656 [Sporobolomyces salmoneus]|uniref:uncharacterized protein n=1 Tax=Sporobolomyces salmoneus TaxID=183962 RepID=UPI00317887AF
MTNNDLNDEHPSLPSSDPPLSSAVPSTCPPSHSITPPAQQSLLSRTNTTISDSAPAPPSEPSFWDRLQHEFFPNPLNPLDCYPESLNAGYTAPERLKINHAYHSCVKRIRNIVFAPTLNSQLQAKADDFFNSKKSTLETLKEEPIDHFPGYYRRRLDKDPHMWRIYTRDIETYGRLTLLTDLIRDILPLFDRAFGEPTPTRTSVLDGHPKYKPNDTITVHTSLDGGTFTERTAVVLDSTGIGSTMLNEGFASKLHSILSEPYPRHEELRGIFSGDDLVRGNRGWDSDSAARLVKITAAAMEHDCKFFIFFDSASFQIGQSCEIAGSAGRNEYGDTQYDILIGPLERFKFRDDFRKTMPHGLEPTEEYLAKLKDWSDVQGTEDKTELLQIMICLHCKDAFKDIDNEYRSTLEEAEELLKKYEGSMSGHGSLAMENIGCKCSPKEEERVADSPITFEFVDGAPSAHFCARTKFTSEAVGVQLPRTIILAKRFARGLTSDVYRPITPSLPLVVKFASVWGVDFKTNRYREDGSDGAFNEATLLSDQLSTPILRRYIVRLIYFAENEEREYDSVVTVLEDWGEPVDSFAELEAEAKKHLAVGINLIHRHGVLHGDLEARNVVRKPGSLPKFIDFGNAESHDCPGSDCSELKEFYSELQIDSEEEKQEIFDIASRLWSSRHSQ